MAFEWLLITIVAPALMFPLVQPIVTAVVTTLVVSMMIAGGIFYGDSARLWQRAGSMRVPVLALSLCSLVGAYASAFPHLTVPKLCGIAFGVMVFRAVLLTGGTLQRGRMLILAYVVVGCAFVLSGVVISPSWPDKVKAIRAIALKIPALVPGLPGAESGVNANALGATTLFFLPLMLVLLGARSMRRTMGETVVYLSAGAVITTVLLLSQSRTAWLSGLLVVALVIALGVRTVRWVRLTVLALAIVAGVMIAIALWPAPAERPSLVTHFGGRALAWSLGLQAIREHPLTGVGLGAFKAIAPGMYPSATPIEVANAHNTFLQVALDTGLPGLLAYLALLGAATKMTSDCVYPRKGRDGLLSLGLWSSLLAVHLFGMTDAIALGAKVGVFFWWNLALIASLHALNVGRARDAVTAGQCEE